MRKTIAGMMALGAAMLVSSSALAQDAGLGAEGSMALSADRLFGIYAYKNTEEQKDQNTTTESTESGTDIALLWANASSPMAIPRLSFDFFVAEGISVGGSAGFIRGTSKYERKVNGNGATADGPTITAFAFAPRVGYAMMFDDTLGLWIRGGVTYMNIKAKSEESQGTQTIEGTNSVNYLDLTVEAPFIISPAPNFAITVGPVIDFPLSGKSKDEQKVTDSANGQTNTTESETEYTKTQNLGIAVGLVGWF